MFRIRTDSARTQTRDWIYGERDRSIATLLLRYYCSERYLLLETAASQALRVALITLAVTLMMRPLEENDRQFARLFVPLGNMLTIVWYLRNVAVIFRFRYIRTRWVVDIEIISREIKATCSIYIFFQLYRNDVIYLDSDSSVWFERKYSPTKGTVAKT